MTDIAWRNDELKCVETHCERQWLYQIGEEAVVYSEAQNRFAGLNAGGLLAFQAFDSGVSLGELQAFSSAGVSTWTNQALDAIYGLSQGRFPKDSRPDARHSDERGDWQTLVSPQSANIEILGIPMLVEPLPEDFSVLANDCFLSCQTTTQPARFHIRSVRRESLWTVSINEREVLSSVRDEQIGLGLLHAVRFLMYAEAQYDVAFHAAMVADTHHGVMLCAPRESGKSTLAAHLAAHGFVFVTDEPAFLCLDKGSISPVEMPISLKEGIWNTLVKEWPQLASAPIHVRSDGRRIKLLHPSKDCVAHTPRRLTHIVFPRYSQSAPASIEALFPLAALGFLNDGGTLLGKRSNKDKFEKFLRFILMTPAFVAHYGTLREAEQMIRDILV